MLSDRGTALPFWIPARFLLGGPIYLFPHLADRGASWEEREQENGSAIVEIAKPA